MSPPRAGPAPAPACAEGRAPAPPLARRSSGRHVVVDPEFAGEPLDSLLANPDRYFDGAYSRILKTDATTCVCAVRVDGELLVIKRYNIRNPWHALKRALRPSRAARCWRVARAMRSRGIPATRPVAYIEERRGPLWGRAWLVTQYREGIDLGRYLTMHEHDAQGERVIRAVAALLHQLARHRFSHGDMKASNLLVDGEMLWLIDLDGAHAHRSARLARHALARDIERFLRNWTHLPALASRIRDALGPLADGAQRP